MSEIIIGIDPDSKKYGIAVWVDGKLDDLDCKNVVQFAAWVESLYKTLTPKLSISFVIEDVKANKFIYSRNDSGNPHIAKNLAQKVGQCKHSQTVAEEFINHYGFNLIHVKPSKDNWAKNREFFERVTGWKHQSNEDTRSAAYFGFLHVQKTRAWHERRA